MSEETTVPAGLATTPPADAAPAAPPTPAAPADAPATPPAAPAEAAPAAPAAEPKEPANAARFAAAARKERELRQRERQIKEAEERVSKLAGLEAKAKENPLEVLQSLGLTYEQLTNYVIDTLGPPKEKTPADLAREAAAAEVDKRLQAQQEKAQQEQARNIKEAEDRLRADIAETLKSAQDAEVVKWAGDADLVIAQMQDIYQRDRRIPTVAEAVTAAESKLVSDLVASWQSMPAKVQQAIAAKIAPAPAAPEKPKEPEQPMPSLLAAARTLTNKLAAATPAPVDGAALTPEQRFQRALARMQGTGA